MKRAQVHHLRQAYVLADLYERGGDLTRARELFRTIEYPVLIHCKSGADRAGMMAVLYRHFHLGEP